MIVLLHIFVNAVAASQMEELTEPLGDNVADLIRDEIGGVLAGVAGFLSSRVAEGTANGVLLARLGYVARRRLPDCSGAEVGTSLRKLPPCSAS